MSMNAIQKTGRSAGLARTARSAGTALRSSWATEPVCLVALVAIWVLYVLGLNTSIGVPLGQWNPLRIVLSGAAASNGVTTVLNTVSILLFGVMAERTLGTWKFIGVAVLTQLWAGVVGLELAYLVAQASPVWGEELDREVLLTPSVWLFGTAAVASAWLPALWRRRMRAVLVGITLTLFMYTGVLADFSRLVAVIIGVAAGQWLAHGGVKAFSFPRITLRESRILVAMLLLAIAVGPLLVGLNHDAAGPLAKAAIIAITWDNVAVFANLAPFAVVFVVLSALSRGRRVAWWLALGVQLVTTVLLLVGFVEVGGEYGWSPALIVSGIGVLLPWLVGSIVLIVRRNLFRIPMHRPVLITMLWREFVVLVLSVGLWLLMQLFFGAAGASFIDVVDVVLPPAVTDNADALVLPCVLFWAASSIVLYMALVAHPNPTDQALRERMRTILQSGGGDHLSWMTLWDGNDYWSADDADGYVAYRLSANVAVTLGEPVCGAQGDRDELARQFEAFAQNNGWTVAWYSVRPEFRDALEQQGWHSVQVAQESVVDCREVKFTGKKFQDVRTARNRAEKEGIRAEWLTWDSAGPALRERIVALSEEWVSDKALPEMGFTLGGIDELQDPQVRLLVALDEHECVHGVTSWLPAYRDGEIDGWVLDFMRRDPSGFRPVVEFLIAEAIVAANEAGVPWVSLSGAPLAHGGPDSQDDKEDVLLNVLDRVGQYLEPLYGFRSLAFFKKKFHPEHVAWSLCYQDELSLASIGVAVSKAYVPRIGAGQAVHVARVWAQG